MIIALLNIRLRQTYRELIEIGFIRFLFLLGFVGVLGIGLYNSTTDKQTSQFVSIAFLLMIILIQIKRKDKLFLKSHFSNYKIFMLAEYVVLSIPLVCMFVVNKQWIAICELLGLLIIINLNYKARHSNLNTKLQKLIPDDAFEWKAGLRKQFFVIVPIWLIAVFTSFFVACVPIAIFLLGALSLEIFNENEPYHILMSYELNSKSFLFFKIKRQLQLLSIIIIPLIILFIIFNPDKWYITVAEYFIFCFIHVYKIMTKYAFYKPNIKSSVIQLFDIIGLAAFFPPTLPIVWFLTIWFYKKSVNNLNFFLNDFNK